MKAKQLLLLFVIAMALCSCKKDHYDTSQVHGAQLEGEFLLPIINASYTIEDMLKRFQIDSVIVFEEGGGMYFEYDYTQADVLKGSDFMKFKNFVFEEKYSIENPYPFVIPQPVDTTVRLDYSVNLESEYVTVQSGKIRSGVLSFSVGSNVANIRSMIIRSDDLKQADGSPLEIITGPVSDSVVIDLAGLYFEAEETHVLNFSHELRVSIENTTVSEFIFDVHLASTEICVQEMSGWANIVRVRNRLDTVFAVFEDNVFGSLEVKGAEVSMSGRNGFGMDAGLQVDTAMFVYDFWETYDIFEPLPVEAVLPVSPAAYAEVLHRKLNAKVNLNSIGLCFASDVIFNPQGLQDLIQLSDSSTIDMIVNVDVPLKFCVDDVWYMDTLDFELSEVEIPEIIKEVTLEMTFHSTLPLNLNGKFYLYDSEHDVVTDTLIGDSNLISASFDGKPTTTNVSFTITEDRVENLFHSDRIFMMYEVDTDARDVALNANQKLEAIVKAKVKYDGVIETNNE